jgi:CheY-like chemotaxis protein
LAVLAGSAAAQAPIDTQPRTPVQQFRDAQALIGDGRFDVAAERLKAFLAANPTDADLLDVLRTDPAAFAKLRRVAVWSDNPAAQAEAVKTVDAIIAKAELAIRTVSRDEGRIRRFVQNLGNIREERLFAINQLRLSGDAVVPVMVDELRTNSDTDTRAGIFEAVTALGADTVPGFLAAADGLPTDLSLGILRAVAGRRDAVELLSTAETDYAGHLWRASRSTGGDSGPLRAFATATLDRLTGGRATNANPTAELVKIADKFARKQARFRSPEPIPLWTWDAGRLNVSKTPATKSQAEEYYAVRAAKWALELSPSDVAAQEIFLATTTERAVERSGGLRELAATDPSLYRILAAAPTGMLVGLLDQALADNRSDLALGLTQVLAARSDRAAVDGPSERKPGVLVKALDYPDPRVQLAAAVGLLRAPGAPTHGKTARVVEVLRRAAAADTDPTARAGKALVADPLDARADKTVRYLRELGYATERFRTGRELLLRAYRAADYDLIVLDRHAVNPELTDVLGQLRSAAVSSGRPVLVVASADKVGNPPLEHLLLRLAVLAAVTDPPATPVTPPFFFDPRRTVADEEKERADNRALRDRQFAELFAARLARLARLVESANLGPNRDLAARLDLRLPQLVLAALAAQYPVSPTSAPDTARRLTGYTDLIRQQPAYAAALDAAPTTVLARIVEQLEGQLDGKPQLRAEFEGMMTRLDPTTLAIAPDGVRDPVLEAQLTRLARRYPLVSVIPEPFSVGGEGFGFRQDVERATAQPGGKPDPATRKQAAKTAVEWLRRLAVGEVTGYDIRPAEPALRQALKDDELADAALDALARIPTAEAQQDLFTVAVAARPVPLRVKAAGLTVRHIQKFGKYIPVAQLGDLGNQAAAEPNPELRANLLVVQQLIAGKPGDVGQLMADYPIPLPQPPKPAPDAGEKKPDEKKPDDKN